MPDLRLRRLAADEPANWPAALTGPATFTALDSWSNFVHSVYRFPIYRFETEIESEVTGLLALTHVRHPILGNYLTTAPFGSYGGLPSSRLNIPTSASRPATRPRPAAGSSIRIIAPT